ncbi:hypothetical protein BHQ18_27860 [Mycolicibacterium flavescens]|uniref:Uncharacterized protein n=1 Tax=Mycolicibacterium flavescens TaxID=1776 RepID=A0A1E3R7Z5_MYCFV|nr:hypothetical protein BHQ18_27860 [Mycolicibacterium flavescens]
MQKAFPAGDPQDRFRRVRQDKSGDYLTTSCSFVDTFDHPRIKQPLARSCQMMRMDRTLELGVLRVRQLGLHTRLSSRPLGVKQLDDARGGQ